MVPTSRNDCIDEPQCCFFTYRSTVLIGMVTPPPGVFIRRRRQVRMPRSKFDIRGCMQVLALAPAAVYVERHRSALRRETGRSRVVLLEPNKYKHRQRANGPV